MTHKEYSVLFMLILEKKWWRNLMKNLQSPYIHIPYPGKKEQKKGKWNINNTY